jgi:SAM-dependent MidA family methyltransferase
VPTETSISVSADALAHSQRVSAFLRAQIQEQGGWIPFSQWMHHALYAPGLGYYAAGSVKLAEAAMASPRRESQSDASNSSNSSNGNSNSSNSHSNSNSNSSDSNQRSALSGDFVTAPQLTPLFGHTLARQVLEVLQQSASADILEFGAGSGALAHSVLSALDSQGFAANYFILEVSADLKLRQQQLLAPWGKRVVWLERTPSQFTGCILANEVLDAMPVELFTWSEHEDQVLQRGVVSDGESFQYQDRVAPNALEQAVRARMPYLPGYRSEINLQAEAWVRDLSTWLTKGAALLIDYGFPRHEFFHPQRQRGTLMCHIQHRAHDDVFLAPGLQDITAHVDFTAIAEAAFGAGLEVLGYTSQSRFLLNSGLSDLLNKLDQTDAKALAQTHGAVQKLLSEAEMGELFKVMALSRGLDQTLSGFSRGDRSAQL